MLLFACEVVIAPCRLIELWHYSHSSNSGERLTCLGLFIFIILKNICMLYRNVLLWFLTAWQQHRLKFFINLPSSRGTGKVPVHNYTMFKTEASATEFLHNALQTWVFPSLSGTCATSPFMPVLGLSVATCSTVCSFSVSSTSSRLCCFAQERGV